MWSTYNINLKRAEHFIAESEKDFEESIGSKYIQSYTVDAFSQFNSFDDFFVFGTPCQIDSLRRWLRIQKIEDHFLLMDFFCHGVPSILLWLRYVEMIEKNIGILKTVTWRNKKTGWHDSWVINAKSLNINGKWNSYFSKGDLFYKMFLGDVCLGKACYNNCKFKLEHSSADIRIGDLWGNKYRNEDKGVNALLVYNSKGRDIISRLKNCKIVSEEFSL